MTGENANQPQPTKPPKKIVVWDALAPHFRAGTRALKDIGRQFDVSDAAILKHAKKDGWTRKIKTKADAKVAKAAVSKADSKTVLATESAVVEANAPVSRAAVSAEVSLTIANTKVSAAVVSAVVSALNDLEFPINFRRFSDHQTFGFSSREEYRCILQMLRRCPAKSLCL